MYMSSFFMGNAHSNSSCSTGGAMGRSQEVVSWQSPCTRIWHGRQRRAVRATGERERERERENSGGLGSKQGRRVDVFDSVHSGLS